MARGVVGASLFATGPRATVPLGRRGVSPSCPSSEARVHLNTVTWLYSRQAGNWSTSTIRALYGQVGEKVVDSRFNIFARMDPFHLEFQYSLD